jgi:hypothetical protein
MRKSKLYLLSILAFEVALGFYKTSDKKTAKTIMQQSLNDNSCCNVILKKEVAKAKNL